MKIKVIHKKWKEVMYAVNVTDSGEVICIDFNGEFLINNRKNIQVIDPEYLPNKDESAKTSDFLPENFFKTLAEPDMSDRSWE